MGLKSKSTLYILKVWKSFLYYMQKTIGYELFKNRTYTTIAKIINTIFFPFKLFKKREFWIMLFSILTPTFILWLKYYINFNKSRKYWLTWILWPAKFSALRSYINFCLTAKPFSSVIITHHMYRVHAWGGVEL